MQKYWQKDFFGNWVLMDTTGKVYKTIQYRVEFRLKNDPKFLYVKWTKANELDDVKEQIQEWLKEMDDLSIKSIQIIEDKTDKVVKEYKRISYLKK